jgi:hypothetical protein
MKQSHWLRVPNDENPISGKGDVCSFVITFRQNRGPINPVLLKGSSSDCKETGVYAWSVDGNVKVKIHGALPPFYLHAFSSPLSSINHLFYLTDIRSYKTGVDDKM